MKLSIVTTLFNSEPYIEEFCTRIHHTAKKLVNNDFEIVLVNDGSPDKSLELAIQLAKKNQHIKIIDLSRNFGHHKAIMTGLAHAQGEKIFLIDSDLEEEPEYLLSFDEQFKLESCDVVYGVQNKRKGGWWERWCGKLFWKIINKLSGLALPVNSVTARLMSRRYVDALLLHQEREIFIAGLWFITGFIQKPQIIKKFNTSKSTYTLKKKIALFVNSVTSFSNMPLIGIFYTGLIIFTFACFYTGYLLLNWLLFSSPLVGWTSVMASVWLIGGLMISFIGIIGIYIAKIFSETKQRPYTIIRQIYD
jgi:putative glycosyltransferase